MPLGTLSIRTNQSNPTHHLYRNGNLWWVHFFVHHSEFKARRVRKSLKTGSLSEAITRRDKLFNGIRKNGHLIPERKTSRGDWTRTSDFSAPRIAQPTSTKIPKPLGFMRCNRTQKFRQLIPNSPFISLIASIAEVYRGRIQLVSNSSNHSS